MGLEVPFSNSVIIIIELTRARGKQVEEVRVLITFVLVSI